MKGRIILAVICLIFIFSFFMINPAFALEKESIVHNKQTLIPKNEKVDNLIVLGHDATINGEVKISVIVIDGDLTINQTANIKGSVLVIGGKVHQQEGAKVSEHIIAINLNSQTANSFIVGGILLSALFIVRLTFSILLTMITVVAGVMMSKKRIKETEILFLNSKKLLAIGFMVSIALGAISILLTILIIGIPVVLLILMAIIFSFVLGMVILSRRIGEQFAIMKDKPDWLVLLVGSVTLVSLINFPLIGGIVLLIILWLSLGFSVNYIFKKVRR
ncbi:hypothetical protein [Bacillus sp. 03113]|uniref:hypothetical protein n=1 Tax=Bacillus sp. 03113 TaxID=2578211 RepID=UPI0011429509|nr:hypothetical protein [Bacillus sp. 03113]